MSYPASRRWVLTYEHDGAPCVRNGIHTFALDRWHSAEFTNETIHSSTLYRCTRCLIAVRPDGEIVNE